MYTTFYNRRYAISTPATYIYLLLACASCWLKGYVDSVGYPVYGEVSAPPLWNAICQILPGKGLTFLIGITLMLLGAFLLHRANYILVLIREKTFLPFLLYILFISTNPDFMPLTSASIGVFCLVLAIYQLFTAYHDEEATGRIYNAALILGIGSLLWAQVLWFIPIFWYGMYVFRCWGVRPFIASLLGVTTVYWFVLGWCVWQGDYTAVIFPFDTLYKIRFLMIDPGGPIDWAWAIYLAFLTTLAAVNIITHEYEDNLRTRQYLYFLVVLIIGMFAISFLYGQSSEELLEMACMPAAILIGHFFTILHGKLVFYLFHSTIVIFVALLFLRLWNF